MEDDTVSVVDGVDWKTGSVGTLDAVLRMA